MPVLKNARRELFCQAVAQGKDLEQAYIEAGFKANKGNPSTLKKKTEVQSRISELLSKRASKVLKATAREAEVTRDTLIGNFQEAFAIAKKAKNGSAMTMATIGMARVLGLIIDRREVGDVGAFSKHTDEELLAEAKARAERLGLLGGVPKLVVDNRPDPKAG